jgi:hypothetical protein
VIFRIVAGIFCAIFLLSAAVQYNDPDPWIWIAGYLFPAALACAAVFGRARDCFWPAAAGAGLYAAAGAWIFPGWISEWFGDEVFREAGGLWIATVWLALLAWRASSLRKS